MVAEPAGTILAMDQTFGVVGPVGWVDMENRVDRYARCELTAHRSLSGRQLNAQSEAR
jgi:hypothetical protein